VKNAFEFLVKLVVLKKIFRNHNRQQFLYNKNKV